MICLCEPQLGVGGVGGWGGGGGGVDQSASDYLVLMYGNEEGWIEGVV